MVERWKEGTRLGDLEASPSLGVPDGDHGSACR